MNIEWNKVTRYSQALAIILFLSIFFLGFWLGTKNTSPEYVQNQTYPIGSPLITSISSSELQIGDTITINGNNFGDWIQKEKVPMPGGNDPIYIFLKDKDGIEHLIWSGESGSDVENGPNGNYITIEVGPNTCVPSVTASGCAYGSDWKVVSGDYDLYITVLGIESNHLSITII